MSPTPLTPSELLAVPDDVLKLIIMDELKGPRKTHSDETSAALRAPEMLDRTYFMLTRLQRNTDGQLAAWSQDLNVAKSQLLGQGRSDRAYIEKKGELAQRRAAAVRFRTSTDVLLQEIKYLRRINQGGPGEFLSAECERLGARIEVLEAAIRRHRDNFPEDEDPSEDDLELWQLATPGALPGDVS